jgi:hypothetical protein
MIDILEQIRLIIDRARHDEDIFIDSRKAAEEIYERFTVTDKEILLKIL